MLLRNRETKDVAHTYRVNDRVIFTRETGLERLCTVIQERRNGHVLVLADVDLLGCVQSFYVEPHKLKPAATLRVEGNTLILEDA